MRQRPPKALFVPLLVWAMVAGTALYPAVAVLASSIMEDLGLTPTTYGVFLFVFSATAASLSPLGGRLADRLGGKSALALTFALTALGFVAIARSHSLWALSMSGVTLAVGQATMNPATNKLIANLTAPGSRGVITGVKQSGVYVGYVITGLLAPPMAAAWGWSSYFVLLASLMALGVVVTMLGLPHDAPGPPAMRPVHAPIARWVNVLAVFGFAMGLGSSSSAFLPLFAETELSFTPAAAGLLATTLGLLAIVARILGARATEQTHRHRLALTLAATTGILFAFTAYLSVEIPILIWVAAFAFSLGFSAWNAIGMLAVIDMAGPERAGAATGRVLMGFLSGLAIGPAVYGRLIDSAGYRSAWIVTGVFAVAATFTIRRWHPPQRA